MRVYMSSPSSQEPGRRQSVYRRLAAGAVAVTLILLMLGAWVRLTDAGLGCPDWPGCYGHLSPAHAKSKISAAVISQGGEHGPVSMNKAWNEMIHRYVAGFVGLLIVALAFLGWKWRNDLQGSPWLATIMVGVVVLQGFFGKWTVTLLLRPAIVTGHLIGGMLTFSLLVWLWQRQKAPRQYIDPEPVAALFWPSVAAVVVVAVQIFLGGWTSTNYAALACADLPTCQSQWWPDMAFAEGFHLFRELGQTSEGKQLTMQALTAIHLSHRIWAVFVLFYLSWLAMRAMASGSQTFDTHGRGGERALGYLLLFMVLAQFSLGLSNVFWSLPIHVAVAHNGGAALLLAVLLTLCLRANRAKMMY